MNAEREDAHEEMVGEPRRRALLRASGAASAGAFLASCVRPPAPEPASPAPPPADGSGEKGHGADAGGEGGDRDELVKSAAVVRGGGVVVAGRKTVITRDDEDQIHGFTAFCTHQGCTVASVSGGTINCPCHGSKFDVKTGEPVAGPARAPLSPVAVEQRGDSIYIL
ncbi:Rieske (2Fe-2S) protein [Streptomyces sp. Lzd4kr]|nr:Rieske (2Fe-2S) protein [Streptomyces sp. Lzd4kr]